MSFSDNESQLQRYEQDDNETNDDDVVDVVSRFPQIVLRAPAPDVSPLLQTPSFSVVPIREYDGVWNVHVLRTPTLSVSSLTSAPTVREVAISEKRKKTSRRVEFEKKKHKQREMRTQKHQKIPRTHHTRAPRTPKKIARR
jgi:hypothetical protein